MSIEILSDAHAIVDEWWDLWRRDQTATPFQSPAWLLPWRQQFQEGESRIVTVRQAGKLMALTPLFRHTDRLLLWGAGPSDWLDGVFDPALDPAELSRGMAELAEPLDLFQLRSNSPLIRVSLPDGWSEQSGFAEACVALDLPVRLSAKMAQNLRYYRRRADKAGIGKPEAVSPTHFEDLVKLHARRWREKGEEGVLADPRVAAWHRTALPALERTGLLRLYVLRLRERIVAALYLLAAKGRVFYYIGGFDPDHAALGLGTVLVGHAISEAEREGAQRFDFLRGREPYKYRWGARDCPTYARHLRPRQAGQ